MQVRCLWLCPYWGMEVWMNHLPLMFCFCRKPFLVWQVLCFLYCTPRFQLPGSFTVMCVANRWQCTVGAIMAVTSIPMPPCRAQHQAPYGSWPLIVAVMHTATCDPFTECVYAGRRSQYTQDHPHYPQSIHLSRYLATVMCAYAGWSCQVFNDFNGPVVTVDTHRKDITCCYQEVNVIRM